MSTTSRGSDFKRLSIILLELLIVINRSECIDYEINRQDAIPTGRTRGNARTTRNILEELNHRNVSKTHNLQDGTEHLLHYGALLRTQILDTFGKLVYDHYDDFGTTQIESLYRIYRETLERKYNIFAIIPSLLKDPDTRPTKICAHINKHIRTCLKESSRSCMNIKIHNEPHKDTLSKPALNVTRQIYKLAKISKNYRNGFSLDAVLAHLRSHRLHLTPELFSGLLHNVQYDSFDDRVRTAERELVYFLTKSPKYFTNESAEVPTNTRSVSRFLQNYLNNGAKNFRGKAAEHAAYLAEHVVREVDAVSENIELLGTIYDNSTINLKYLFELILPNDTVDQDVAEARDYLLRQMKQKKIVETHLQVEKYQQSGPDQLLMEILGQLRDMEFAEDLVSSLYVHARFWHKSHMIENLNALLELFDAYENLRGIPEFGGLLETVDKIRKNLRDSKNVTVELLCSRPRACLRIGLETVANCGLINDETKRAIELFISRTTCGCSCLNEDPKTVTESGTSVGVEITTNNPKAIDVSETNEATEKSPENTPASVDLTTESIQISTSADSNEDPDDDSLSYEYYEESSEETGDPNEKTTEVPSTILPAETLEKPCEGDCHLGDCNGTHCSSDAQGNCTGAGCSQGNCEGSECQDSDTKIKNNCKGPDCPKDSEDTKCEGPDCSERSCEDENCSTNSSSSDCDDEDCSEDSEQLPVGSVKGSCKGPDCLNVNRNVNKNCNGKDCISTCKDGSCQDDSHEEVSCEGTDCTEDLEQVPVDSANENPCKGPDCPIADCTGPDCRIADCKGPNCPIADCKGPDCPITNCKGPNCPVADCKGPDCPTTDCKGPNCPIADCKGPDCPIANCKGPDCPVADCKGPDCPSTDCKGPDCPIVDCKGPDCPIVDCKGPDCPIVDCKGPDCPIVDCKGPDCPIVDCKGPDCPITNCTGLDCPNTDEQCKGEDCFGSCKGDKCLYNSTHDGCEGTNCTKDPQQLPGGPVNKVSCEGPDCPDSSCKGPECPDTSCVGNDCKLDETRLDETCEGEYCKDNSIGDDIECKGPGCSNISCINGKCEGNLTSVVCEDSNCTVTVTDCRGPDCPTRGEECKGPDCVISQNETGTNCTGADCLKGKVNNDCKGSDCPFQGKNTGNQCEGTDCLESNTGDCKGANCPASPGEENCKGVNCTVPKLDENCRGADCPALTEKDCKGADCPVRKPNEDCEGADCPVLSEEDCKGGNCSVSRPGENCQGADCPVPKPVENCKGADCLVPKPVENCKGADCLVPKPGEDCKGADCPASTIEGNCEGPDCPRSTNKDCEGADCPPSTTKVDCEGLDCPKLTNEDCKGADCPPSTSKVDCEGPDCSASTEEEDCEGADCSTSIKKEDCKGADCSVSTIEDDCEGSDCLTSTRKNNCEGADCSVSTIEDDCEGSDCLTSTRKNNCEGADCSVSTIEDDCEGADCPASTKDKDCEGADCPASTKDKGCEGADCPASTKDKDCEGADCPASNKENCEGPACQERKEYRSCEGADCSINVQFNRTDCGSSGCPPFSDDSENPCKGDDCSNDTKETCQGGKCSTTPSAAEIIPIENSTIPTITLSPVIEMIHPNRTTFCDNSDPHYRRKLHRLQKMRRIDANSSTSRIETWGAIFAASSFVSEERETTEEIVSKKENVGKNSLLRVLENAKNNKTASNSHRNRKKNIWNHLQEIIKSQSEEKTKEVLDRFKQVSTGLQKVVDGTDKRNHGRKRNQDLKLEKIIPKLSYLKRAGKVRNGSWTGSDELRQQKSRETNERRDYSLNSRRVKKKDSRSNSEKQIQEMINESDMRKVSGSPIKRDNKQVPIVHFLDRGRKDHEKLGDDNNKYDISNKKRIQI